MSMEIAIEWHGDQFNVALTSAKGQEPFITIKGARIVDGAKGAFVSWPATKNQTSGKWWSHVWGSDKFNAVILERAQATRPQESDPKKRPAPQDDQDESIPF